VAGQIGLWESDLERKGEKTSRTIRTQIELYTSMLRAMDPLQELTAAWIRALHAEICKDQGTHKVVTPAGVLERPLRLGEYKAHANSVTLPDGTTHEYAPPELVAAEMLRLCDEARTDDFRQAHPVYQASYVHYALTVIHPFADGNGRVSRAVASRLLYPDFYVPFLVLSSDRESYFQALQEADRGNYNAFIDFTLQRLIDTIRLVEESLRTLLLPDGEDTLKRIRALYETPSGFHEHQLDQAAYDLTRHLEDFLQIEIRSFTKDPLWMKIERYDPIANPRPVNTGYRVPGNPGILDIVISAQLSKPINIHIKKTFYPEIPQHCKPDDAVIIRGDQDVFIFEVLARELLPAITESALLRLRLFARSLIARLLDEALEKAQQIYPA
jgi:hypothetical protein